MGRRPRIFSPEQINKNLLRQNFYSSVCAIGPDISHAKVRGLVRGLLNYFSLPSKWRALDQCALDVLEQALLASVECTDAESQVAAGASNEAINQVADRVREVVESLRDHPSKSVLAVESNGVIQNLDGYPVNGRHENKLEWLEGHLPDILRSLLYESQCAWMSCPRRKNMPDRRELEEWTEINSIGEVRLRILAHHHGVTYSVVRDRFNRRTPRRGKRLP